MPNSADILRDARAVLDIGGNKYRLVARVNFQYGVVHARLIGTHPACDAIDPHAV